VRIVPLIFAPALTLAASHSTATTIHVPGDEPTIAAGILAAAPGDTVLIACGDYAEHAVLDKEIVLRGETGLQDCVMWEGITQTTPILQIQSVNQGARVEGITFHGLSRPKLDLDDASPRITDCAVIGEPGSGRGIEMHASSPVMIRCEITGNTAHGVYSFEGSPQFVECTFVENSSTQFGGAFRTVNGSPSLIDCEFRENSSTYFGGAVHAMGGSAPLLILGSRFFENSAELGGAIHIHAMSVQIDSCEFRGNSARSGGAVRLNSYTVGMTISRSTFWQNSSTVSGGACEFDRASATISECRFFENHTDGIGGALSMEGRSTSYVADVADCTIMRNSAPNGGHGISLAGRTTAHLSSTLISHGLGGTPTARSDGSILTFDCCDVYDSSERDLEFYSQIGVNSNFSADPIFCDEASGGSAIADESWCRPAINGCGLVGVPEPGNCSVPGVYLTTDPPGLLVEGDGEARRGAAFYRWDGGSVHTISAPIRQDGSAGIQHEFASWDDGGDLSHPIVVSGDFQVHTATFDSLFLFTGSVQGTGTITPADSLWLELGTQLEIVATPGEGWTFDRWEGEGEGSYTGTDSAATITMNAPISQTAIFVPGPIQELTVVTDPAGLQFRSDGVWYTAPHRFFWDLGSIHGVRIDQLQWIPGLDGRQRFTAWSNGHTARSFIYTANHGSPDTVTAFFTPEFQLTFVADVGGSTTPEPDWFDPGTEVEIEAIPDFGYVFDHWIGFGAGSYTGPDNPVTVTMNESIRQRPLFSPIGHGYDFTISASDTDPDVQIASPAGGMRNLYLWATCNERGITAMEFDAVGTLDPIAFVPLNGVFNVGSPSELLLAVPGCPTGDDLDFLMGYWIVQDDGGSLCLGPSQANGIMGVVDCEVPVANLWPFRITGFASDGGAPCFAGSNGCGEDPVPVGLTQLRATAEDRAVRLSWISSSQVDYAGFWVYRSDLRTGGFAKLNPELWRTAAPYEYLDTAVEADRTYFYRVGAVDRSGVEELSDVAEITTSDWKPFVTGLSGIRPNPFVNTSEIQFSVARRGPVRLSIFDVSGRLIRTILDGELSGGEHTANWDGRNSAGALVTAGVYFTRLEALDATQTKKTVFLGGR
jgi:hypothetical protein